MNNGKAFSGVEHLPSGDAPYAEPVNCCLVLEGGAFRGVYGEGVLDYLLQQGIHAQTVIGVSAGALNGLNYTAGNIGRSARINLKYRHNDFYVGREAFIRNQGVIGFDFLFSQRDAFDPLNKERFFDPKRRYVAVATNCRTGKPEYFDRDTCPDIYKAIQASASMPYVSRMVMVGRKPCLDGGCSVKVPFRWAMEQGYDKIVVVRSRETAYRKKGGKISEQLAEHIYDKFPAFAETLAGSDQRYNEDCDEMDRLEKEGRIFVFAPSKSVHIGRLEKDMEKLGAFYYLGYNDCRDKFDDLMKYLEIEPPLK